MGQSAAPRRRGLPPGVEIRTGKTGESLRIAFVWQGVRRRESLGIPATPTNIKYAANLRASVQLAIEKGTFDYALSFPNSKTARENVKPVAEKPIVKALVDEYIDVARRSKALSPSTIASYARWAKARVNPKFGHRVVEEIQTPELRTWISELTGALAVKSIRNCVGLLSAVLNRAQADSIITSNPLAPISLKSVLPKQKQNKDEDGVDPFNDAEINIILAACRTIEERALWQFALSSGLRTGELIALKDTDLDEAKGLIRVQDNIVSAEIGTIEKETKTYRMRVIPMLPGAREAITLMKSLPQTDAPYFFTNPKTKRRWLDDQQMRKGSWIPTLKLAGVRYRYPYQTRHTFASRLLMAGEPELLVAKLLGHTTVEMVRRSYGKYIKQSGGLVLKGDYSKFGADLGHVKPG